MDSTKDDVSRGRLESKGELPRTDVDLGRGGALGHVVSVVSTEGLTTTGEPSIEPVPGGPKRNAVVAQESIYPHVFDPGTRLGSAIGLFRSVPNAIDTIIDLYDSGDLGGVSVSISQVAALLSRVEQSIAVPSPLGAIVAFIRRGLLASDPAALSRAELLGLQSAVRLASLAPVMTLSEAAEIRISLEDIGWRGSEVTVAELVRAFMEDEVSEAGGEAVGATS